jgi:hypothetical protein
MDQSNRGAFVTGGIVGLLAALLSLVLSLVSAAAVSTIPFCACLTGPMNWMMPAGAGLLAGLLAALRADWSEVPAESRMGYGIGLGLRGSVVASLIAGLAFLTVAVVMPILQVLIFAVTGGASDIVGFLVAAAVGMVVGWVMSTVIALGSGVFGIILGVGGGAIVAATKGNEG